MTDIFLTLDLGTTNVRTIIFDDEGNVLGQAFQKMAIYRPKSDTAEEDPEEIWKGAIGTMKDAVKTTNISADEISMISFSAQMHGITMVDSKARHLNRLLTWQDRRALSQSKKLSRKIDPHSLYKSTGCPDLPIYPLPKILWLKDKMPRKFEKCSKLLSAKDYVILKMLGKAYLDLSTASGTQLLNIHKLEWDEELLNIIGIDREKLPVLASETEIIGELPEKIAKYTGLKKGTPIILGASDGAASNIGLGAIEGDIAAINIGTSGALRVLSDKPSIDKRLDARFFCYYATSKKWLVGGAVNNAGELLRWFKDNFGYEEEEQAKERGIDPYQIMLKNAARINPGADGLVMLPFFAGERFPIRDSLARGALFGLTYSHNKTHVTRTILESVIYTLRWIMETLEEHGIRIRKVRVGGGGARSSIWRQIQADILGKPVLYPKVEEASALGAAMLAAISKGTYKNLRESTRNMVKLGEDRRPNRGNYRKYSRIFTMYKELYHTMSKFYEEMPDL